MTNPSKNIWGDFFILPDKEGMILYVRTAAVTKKVEIQDYTIFENINTNVQKGDIIGIIGKNGAGKSTLLQLLNGDFPSTEGQIKHVQNDLIFTMVEQETESYSFDEVTP